MPGCRKRRHVGTDLGQNDLRRYSAHTGNRNELCDRIAKRRQQLLDPRIKGCDMALQLFDQPKMTGDQEPMMRRHAAVERSGSARGHFRRVEPSSASLAGFVSPAIIAFKMRRPLVPTMSEITDVSLMLAFSSVF